MKAVTIVCITVFGLAFLASLVFLQYAGKDTSTLTSLLNTLLGAAGLLTGTGAMVYSNKAAKQSTKAAQQTNGGLDKRIEDAVHNVLNERRVSDGRQAIQRPRVDRDSGSGNDDRKSTD